MIFYLNIGQNRPCILLDDFDIISLKCFSSLYQYIYYLSIRGMVNTAKKRIIPTKHIFRIIGNPEKFIKNQVEVSFQPFPKKKTTLFNSIIPTFNKDRKYYTVAFRLPSSEIERDEQLQKEHQRRVCESQLQITQILYPKPRSKHKYCGVCKQHYQDYKDHVQSQPHMHKLRTSPFQKLIIESAEKIAELVPDKKYQEDKNIESCTEDQLFKCISFESTNQGYGLVFKKSVELSLNN